MSDKRKFSEWNRTQLTRDLGLMRIEAEAFHILPEPLGNLYMPSEKTKLLLNDLQQKADDAHDWDEKECRLEFWLPLFDEIGFSSEIYSLFYKPRMEAYINGTTSFGNPEYVFALKDSEVQPPVLFIQDYTQISVTAFKHPEPNLVIAMLAAQDLNGTTKQAIYGGYMVNSSWHLVMLQSNVIKVGLSLDIAHGSDLIAIYRILCSLKSWAEKNMDNFGLKIF